MRHTIRECQRGSALAWENLIREHQGRVYAAAFYYLKSREEAQDVTQETFLRVYRTLDSFRSEESAFLPWLMTITRNCAIDRLRKSGAMRRYEEPQREETAHIGDEKGGPEEEISAEQRRSLIYRALDRFNEINREILLLKDIEGMKVADVARILSLPVGTVKSRSNRARIRLAKILSGQHVEEEGPESELI